MRLKVIILMLFSVFFIGCSDNSGEIENSQSSLVTPQPTVADDSLRPPKPPSI